MVPMTGRVVVLVPVNVPGAPVTIVVYEIVPALGMAVWRTTVTSPGLVAAGGSVVVWVPSNDPKIPVIIVT